MNKFIILTPQDMVDWGGSNLPFSQIRAIGTDGSGVFVFDAVPSRFSSKTVYDKSEFDAMLRDGTSVFYVEGY
tara:strand:- start:115 stop:333 length:219 start_codon:yes stop_codon:yes gene_type:complete